MTRYGFEHEKPERLAGIEATWDPGTRELLGSLGVGSGWRCLEAGAGGGSIAAWLADRVGREGSVLAVDIDTTYLEPLAGGVLEVRRHDLRRRRSAVGSFDLVHERSVLSWLGESDALERLVGALAPGGWLVVEDFDWAIAGPATAPVGGQGLRRHHRADRSVGYDRHYGRTLPAAPRAIGARGHRSEGRAYVLRGGSPGTAFDRFSMLASRCAPGRPAR